MNLAIITARGGSKRIPRKNIKEFCGKPMLSYAIEAALGSDVFNEVMVSTDDEEIAKTALSFGALVPFLRSEKTSDDYATSYDVLAEVLSVYKQRGLVYDNVCCIYPCVPFLNPNILREAYQIFISEACSALIPVCKYSVPIEWAMQIVDDKLVPSDISAQQIRSQDLVPKYFDAGMFYFLQTQVLLRDKTLIPKNTRAFVLDETIVQDIDTEQDWHFAEIKYHVLTQSA